jgi:D-serine deaminase-like pyridoxal phosphate-dependent protein
VLHPSQTYSYYKEIFKGKSMPFAFVDLDRFDDNTKAIVHRAKNKTIRIASKSIRSISLMKRILSADKKFQGIMVYHAKEASWLSQQGFDDILIGYPSWHDDDIMAVVSELKKGKKIVLMIDLSEHIEHINETGKKEKIIIPVCLDIDMSSRFPGLYFGVHRSGINTKEKALKVWKIIQQSEFVKLEGVMGYEAQIAGLNNAVPGKFLMNSFISLLKNRSFKEISNRRTEIVNELKNAGAELRFVNGGGTGSLEWTTTEDAVTEVTAGSGFFCSGLFDHYSNFSHYPAAAYAIEIVRQPEKNIFTATGGGYIASGASAKDKLPKPFFPEGMQLIENEGAGEVQTPFVYSGSEKLKSGSPVFFRHAKAGELCERFEKLFLISSGKIIDEVNTYRGDGKCFV